MIHKYNSPFSARTTKCFLDVNFWWTFFIFAVLWPHSKCEISTKISENTYFVSDVIYSEKNLFTISGYDFSQAGNLVIRQTFSDTNCQNTSEPLSIIYRNKTKILASGNNLKNNVMQSSATYLCFIENNRLQHMGLSSKVKENYLRRFSRDKRNKDFESVHNEEKSKQIPIPKIFGFRIEESQKEFTLTKLGVPEILSGTSVLLRLFGSNLIYIHDIVLTEETIRRGSQCILPKTIPYKLLNQSLDGRTALVRIDMPKSVKHLHFCSRHNQYINETGVNFNPMFTFEGNESWLTISIVENLIPVWAAICIIITCLLFSALFSGLNLGLMSLDRTELKILRNTGTAKEKEYAAKIQPIRDHGNYLLCSILLGNVLVNSTFTILLDGLTSGVIAVVCSTLLIVVFGEITPQAICSRHGLAVGAHTIIITKAVMLLTFPLAYPTSKFLDYLLGEEIGNVYNRERLKELVRITKDVNDLDKDEVNIISGALELRKKSVAEVMTHIEDAFMLSYDAILDFETVSEIMKSGFSRIPVYEGDRKNVCTLLFIKDLAFVDPDDNTPLRTLCEYYQNPCHFVFEDATLDVLFKQFKEGLKGHMAFVHRVNSEGDGDPFYETIGLVTLEDVIEELIQAEIMDETDVYTDNRTKVRRARTKKQDFTGFAERRDNNRIRISPQLTLATFQYLTTIDAFKSDIISETILRRLLNQDVVHHLKCKGKDKNDPSMLIYQQGKAADYFVLILEGRVEVTVGRENLIFESGPFTYFGIQSLVQNVGVVDSPEKGSLQSLNMDALLRHTFVPDYSVKAVTEIFYISIKRTLYLAAKRATLMERSQIRMGELGGLEPIDDEVEKLLNSLDEDDRSIGTHTANLNAKTSKQSTPSPVNSTSQPDQRSPSKPGPDESDSLLP